MTTFGKRSADEYSRLMRLFGNGKRFFGYALALTGNTDDAEDLLQECVLKALKSIHLLRDDGAFETWFFRLIKHMFIDLGRRKRPTAQLIFHMAGEWQSNVEVNSSAGADPQRLAIRSFANETIWQAISMLSAQHADVIVLHYILGYTVPEIVRITGDADGTVRSRISRARSKLRDLLLPLMEESTG